MSWRTASYQILFCTLGAAVLPELSWQPHFRHWPQGTESPSIHLSIHISIYMSISFSLSVSKNFYLYTFIYIYLSVFRPLALSVIPGRPGLLHLGKDWVEKEIESWQLEGEDQIPPPSLPYFLPLLFPIPLDMILNPQRGLNIWFNQSGLFVGCLGKKKKKKIYGNWSLFLIGSGTSLLAIMSAS